jgi:PleD family two-component response regulator
VSSEKPSGRLLIVEEDAHSGAALRQHFEAQGYEVLTAQTGRQGLDLAQTGRPDLILLAARMPDMSGLEAFRALRDKPRTGHIPVMMMAGHNDAILQNKVLEEGAYDFLEKPLDLDILTLRVRNALRRAEREGRTEPRTGLPTGRLIDERLDTLADEPGWYKIDLVIDSFGAFRDLYGFVTANEALRFAGNLIAQIVNEHGGSDDFVGHISGTEQFVIITTQTHGPRLCGVLTRRVSEELESFYSFVERDQGYVLLENGAGGYAQKPLMLAQITTAQGEPDPDAPPSQDMPAGDDTWVDAEDDESSKPDDSASGSAFDW